MAEGKLIPKIPHCVDSHRRLVYYKFMSTEIREHILACGGRIIHHKGYAATGLTEILTAAGVPKGSFYFYFKSKEDFGLALIEYYQRWFGQQVTKILEDETLSPLARLAGFFTWFREYFVAEDCTKGCPIGNLTQELGDVNPAFRGRLKDALDRLIGRVGKLLHLAAERGELPDNLDPDQTAAFLVAAWQGALVCMKASASPEPLDIFQKMIFETLLCK